MDKIKRFLIIRLDEIGDYILTAPLLRELKKNFPEAEIDLIVKPSLIGFVSGSPYVSRVWGAEVKRRKLLKNWRLFFILLLRRMRCGRYGVAILPRPSPDRSCSRLLAWIAGAEKILAYSTSLAGPDQWIPTTLLQKENEHNVNSNLRFLDSLGIHAYDASLHLKDLWKDEISADQWKSRICWSSDRKYALCSPCSISEIRNWGKENYCEVIRRLFTELGYVTILTGLQDDSGTVDWICAHSPQGSCVSLCGKTELGDLPSVMRLGSFYFGADTSAVHFAAAAGLPCVVLTPHAHGYEGWLSAETRFRPWQVPCRIVTPPARIPPCGMECRGPGSHCITGISADTVFIAVTDLLMELDFAEDRLMGKKFIGKYFQGFISNRKELKMQRKTKRIPLLLIHKGWTPYLPYILHQLKESNPDSRIILIGDQKACSCASFIETHLLENYLESANAFTCLYRNRHRSYNSFFSENICFQRTFIMENFCRVHDIDCIWHLDSDVLVYTDINEKIQGKEFQYALLLPPDKCRGEHGSISPHTACWTYSKLVEYNLFLLQCMTPGSEQDKELEEFWTYYRKEHSSGGVCDMTALYLFVKYHPEGLLNLFTISDSGRFSLSYFEDLSLYGDSARIKLQNRSCFLYNGENTGEMELWTLHMQGSAKWLIPDYYIARPFRKQMYYLFLLFCFRIKTSTMARIRKIFRRNISS